MLYPTINELTKDKYNRYELSLATAKCARIVTNEYVRQRDEAERSITGNKETDKPINVMIDKELRDEKAVRIAIRRIHEDKYEIVRRPEGYIPEEEPVFTRTGYSVPDISAFEDDEDDAAATAAVEDVEADPESEESTVSADAEKAESEEA